MQSFLVLAGDVLAFLTAALTLAAEVARRKNRRRTAPTGSRRR
ncbi:hypothetical protein [Streptomyces pharetrae]